VVEVVVPEALESHIRQAVTTAELGFNFQSVEHQHIMAVVVLVPGIVASAG
jgi:hypothetical protein